MEKFISKTRTKRKFKDEYIEYGFSALKSDGEKLPFCLLCNKALLIEALVPSKLKRHLEAKHSALKDKLRGNFENLAEQ